VLVPQACMHRNAIGCGFQLDEVNRVRTLLRMREANDMHAAPHSTPVPRDSSCREAGSKATVSTTAGSPEPAWVLLAELPPGDALRTRTLGAANAECRNKLSKEWKNVARWVIGAYCYDELGAAWTDTSEFRVPKVASTHSAG
jgi:hypothetical protein